MLKLTERVKIKEASLKEMDNNIVFQGNIEYAGIEHRRIITYRRKSRDFLIEDTIFGTISSSGNLRFHLAPNLSRKNTGIFINKTNGKLTSIELNCSHLEGGTYYYSPEYGVKMKAYCLFAEIILDGRPKTIKTHIGKLGK